MLQRRRLGVRKPVALGALVVTGIATWAAISLGTNKEGSMTSQSGSAVASDVTAEELAEVSQAKVFFGHQSVGMNILDGVPGVYSSHGMQAPVIEQAGPGPGEGGGIDHAFIGENGKPLLKIQDFDAKLRSGIGDSVDVAMMKFCYIDVDRTTNVDELFAAYRTTMTDLQRDFPNVTFVYATVPLTTDPGLLSTLKSWVKGSGGSAQADNAARERMNELIRHEYSGQHLFDLAAVESTAPDGGRATGTYDGQPYFRLYDGYASDPGHLNEEGARVAATAWLKSIAQATAK